LKKKPSYSLCGRKSTVDKSQKPGPGTYEYKTTVKGVPCMRFGSSKRRPLSASMDTPGPGGYNPRP